MADEANVHLHPAWLQQLKDELEEMNRIDIEAKRNKSEREAKLAEFGALVAVLEFLDRLNIESFPLLRSWKRMGGTLDGGEKRRGRGRRERSDDTWDLRAHALVAMDFLEKGGMPPEEAEEEIRRRFKKAGAPLAESALEHWHDDCNGRGPGAKTFRAVRKEYEPSAMQKLMMDKQAHWSAAGRVLRMLDFLIRTDPSSPKKKRTKKKPSTPPTEAAL
jgi:hypothetical protein